MIKWIYFLKSLKLCLFGLLISSIMVVGNFLSSYFIEAWLWYVENQYLPWYDFSVLKKWKFLTNFLWTTKPILAISWNVLVFWNNWQLYLYDNWTSCRWWYACSQSVWELQWYFTQMMSCDEFTWWSSYPQNCWSPIEYNSEIVWNFLRNFEGWDWFYYNHSMSCEWYCRGFNYDMSICYSSRVFHKSLCFTVSKKMYWSGPATPWVWISSEWLWLNQATFAWIPLEYLENPPLYQWDVSSVESWNIVEIPSELMTNEDVMSYFQDTWGWDRDICYVWTTDLSSNYSWDYTRLWWYNIFEAYSILYTWTNVSDPNWLVAWTNTMNVGAWINTLYNNYYTYYVKRLDYLTYEWNPLHYSFRWNNWLYSVDRSASYYPFDWRSNVELALWSKYYNRYQNTDQNWQDIAYYCSAVLSPSGPNDIYDWTLPNYLVNNINWQVNNHLNQSTDWQNSDYQVPSWSWFMLTWNEDFSSSLKDFYAKLTMKLNTDWNYRTTWIIPDYILWFLVLIILFRFLKK